MFVLSRKKIFLKSLENIIENAKYAEGLGIESVLMTPLLSFKNDSEFYDVVQWVVFGMMQAG